MAISPILTTKRLQIKPFAKEHLSERYVGWLNDKATMQFSEQRHKIHTLQTCDRYFRSFEKGPDFFWAIEETEEGQGHIGNINAYIDSNNNVADVGILIGEENARHQGLAQEGINKVFEYLFSECGIRKITAGAMSVNIPMIKLMQSLGMVSDGVRTDHYIYQGELVDIIYMARFSQSE